jgi:hypothetical protein
MFEDFLREHIKDLIECGFDNYKINESDIEYIVCIINNNEKIWDIIDSTIYNELDKYKEED